MSARGARSRKVQQKDIQKKEKQVAVQGKAPEFSDASTDWRAPSSNGTRNAGLSRSITVSSSLSHGTSRSSGTNDSGNRSRLDTVYSNESSSYSRPPKTSTSGAASVSDHSAKGTEKTKFQANGKETKAPRGRGGGVPIKTTIASSPAPPSFRTDSPSSRLPSHRKTWLDFKIWEGESDEMRPYGGFAFDEDMHNGSVLIYFKEEQMDEDHPVPSIRAELDVLQNSGSSWLTNALMMGRLDEDEDDWALPAADEYMMPTQHDRRLLDPRAMGGMSPPPLDSDRISPRAASRAISRTSHNRPMGQERSPSATLPRQSDQQSPTHEIWFTAPSELRSMQAQRLHHVAIRNFLAILHGKAIVGADLFDMLSTLQSQIQVMYDLDHENRSGITPAERSVQMITNCIGQYGIDDVRNDIRHAIAMLAWAEQDSVRWRQGYLECFTHIAGAVTPHVEDTAEFKRLSIVTRRNLGIAAKTLQLRVMEAEEKLATFDFADLWKDSPKLTNGPVYSSYQSFRQFLTNHYGRIYGTWPPPSQGTWLNRKTVLAMQNDFGSLYDYLVDRDVYWNPREERASRKWEMQHRKTDEFEADLPELGITDMLVMYDAKASYAHIPHPYPLLPREVSKSAKDKEKKGFFSSLKRDKTKDVTKDAKAHLQLSIVFSDATNIEKLDVNFNGSTLIDKFEQFELTTDLKNGTPREARLGRWVLLYAILQVLSTLSVDVQGLKHTKDVRYFLCTDLKRCPEWVTNGQMDFLEVSQQRSWCWQRAWDPTPIRNAPVELPATTSPDRHVQLPERSLSNTQTHTTEYGHNTTPPPQRPLPPAPLDYEGATLVQDDIARLSEKIESLSMGTNGSRMLRQEYERRRDNEKVMAGEFKSQRINDVGMDYRHLRTDDTYRLTESEYANRPLPAVSAAGEREMYANRPLPPPRSPLRSPVLSSISTELGGYSSGPAEMGFPSPPGYGTGRERSGSRPPGYGSEMGGARDRFVSKPPGYEERGVRRERGVYERSGWQ